MCRRGGEVLLLFGYGDDELVHAPLALVNPAIVEHQRHHPPGEEAALPSRPPQILAAAGGLPPAAPGRAHQPRLLLGLVPGGRAAGSLLLELPPAEEVDVAVLRVLLVPLCKDVLGGGNGISDVRQREN